MNDVKIFESNEFGKVRTVTKDGDVWFVGKDVAELLEYARPSEAISAHCKGTLKHRIGVETGIKLDGSVSKQEIEVLIIPERDLYRLIMRSKMPKAEKFEEWVVGEVIPSIRKTGSFIANNQEAEFIAVNKVLSRATPEMLAIFANMAIIQKGLIEDNEKLAIENKVLVKEVEYKEDIIISLVDDVDLATKRQRLNQIIRHNAKTGEKIADKWKLLYSEFEKIWHIDIKRRMETCVIIPKVKNKLDYVDRVLNKIPSIYEVACKIFESDVEELKKEWFETVSKED